MSLTGFQHIIQPLLEARKKEVLQNTLKAPMSFMIRIVISDVFAPASTSTVSGITSPRFWHMYLCDSCSISRKIFIWAPGPSLNHGFWNLLRTIITSHQPSQNTWVPNGLYCSLDPLLCQWCIASGWVTNGATWANLSKLHMLGSSDLKICPPLLLPLLDLFVQSPPPRRSWAHAKTPLCKEQLSNLKHNSWSTPIFPAAKVSASDSLSGSTSGGSFTAMVIMSHGMTKWNSKDQTQW